MTAMEASLTRLAVSRSRLIRWTLTSAGFVCVAVAIVGLFVPLLPTTDFLLLSALCFGKSSPAASEEGDEHTFEHRILPDNDAFDFEHRGFEGGAGFVVAVVHGEPPAV